MNENEIMMQEAIDSIETYTKDSQHFFEWLDWMATFPQYSVRNQLLIKQQRPKAQFVTNKNRLNQFKQPSFGKPITILAPDIHEYIKVNDQEIDKEHWTRDQYQAVKRKEIKSYTQMGWKDLTVYEIDPQLSLNQKKSLVPQLPLDLHDPNKNQTHVLYQALKNVAVDHHIKMIETPMENQQSEIVRSTKDKKQLLIKLNPQSLSDSEKLRIAIRQVGYALSYQQKKSKNTLLIAELNSYILSKALQVEPLPQTIETIQQEMKQLSGMNNRDIVDLLDQSAKMSKKIVTELSPELNRLEKIMKPEKEVKQTVSKEVKQKRERNKLPRHSKPKVITRNSHAKKQLRSLRYFFNKTKTLLHHLYYRFHVQLAHDTTLDMIQQAKTQKKESRLSFRINGKAFTLTTNRKTGESRLYEGQKQPILITGSQKYYLLKKLEPYDYLPMSIQEYQKMDQLKERHLYPTDLSYQFLVYSNLQNKLKFNQLNQQFDSETGRCLQPFVSINHDSERLKAGSVLSMEEWIAYSKQHPMDKVDCNLHISPNEYHTFSDKTAEELTSLLKENQHPHQEDQQVSDELEVLHLPIKNGKDTIEYHIQIEPQTKNFTGTYQKDQQVQSLSTQQGLSIFRMALVQCELASDERELIQQVLNKETEKQARMTLFKQNQQRIEETYPLDIPNDIVIQQPQNMNWEINTRVNSPIQSLEEQGINGKLLQLLSEKQFLTVDSNHQLHFNWNDNGKKVGDSIYSSDLDRYHDQTTLPNSSFNLKNGEPKQLKCFENPMELISYLSLHGIEKETQYLSFNLPEGKAIDSTHIESVFHHYMEIEPSIQEVDLCIADDNKANQIASHLYPQANPDGIESIPFNITALKKESSFFHRCQEKQASILQGLSSHDDQEQSL